MKHTMRLMMSVWMLLLAGNLPVDAEVSQTQSDTTTIPVLCYHRFGDYGAEDAFSVSTKEFEEQLEIIREENMTPITVTQLVQAMRNVTELPAKPVLITIDDGYRDFLTQAKPLLEQFGYTATLFIYTDFVDIPLGLTTQELKALQEAGYDIGSHSVSHPKLNCRKEGETQEAYHARLFMELDVSRKKLRTWSGGEVAGLAYPYGLWNAEVAKIAQEAGYSLMFTVNPGTNTLQTNRTCLKRNIILRGMRESTFRAMLRVQELSVAQWEPPLGEVVNTPLSGISMVIDESVRSKISPATLTARTGNSVIPSRYDQRTGMVTLQFSKPWTQGTNLIILTAQGRDSTLQYKQARLIQIVLPAHE